MTGTRETASASGSPGTPGARRAAAAVRIAVGLAGLAGISYGCWLVWTDTRPGTLPDLPLWLAGAVAAHDGLLVPLVLLAGLALRRVPGRPVWRGALLTAGCLTLLALPLMLWQGQPANPSVLPLDYRVNWLLALAGTALATACVWLLRTVRAARARQRERNGRP